VGIQIDSVVVLVELASQDFVELMKLVYFEKWEIVKSEHGLEKSKPYANVHLRRDSEEMKIPSTELDFFNYVVMLEEVADAKGRIRFVKIKNREQYYRDLDALLLNEDNKIREAIRKMNSGQFKLDFDVESGLDKLLSGSRDFNDPNIAGLKTHYFEVLACFIKLTVQFAKTIKEQSKKNTEFARYYRLYDEVLRLGFMPAGKRIALKDYVSLRESLDFGLLDVVDRTEEQKEYAEFIFGLLGKEGRVDAANGIRCLLDIYRRFCELCYPFLNLACRALALPLGKKPKEQDRFSEVVDALRRSKFWELVDIVNPTVRHCEAHVSTRVRYHPTKKGEAILIDSRPRPAKELGRLTFDEVCEMSRKMYYCLNPALREGFALFLGALSILTLKSFEFKTLLASLGQVT